MKSVRNIREQPFLRENPLISKISVIGRSNTVSNGEIYFSLLRLGIWRLLYSENSLKVRVLINCVMAKIAHGYHPKIQEMYMKVGKEASVRSITFYTTDDSPFLFLPVLVLMGKAVGLVSHACEAAQIPVFSVTKVREVYFDYGPRLHLK